jgi:uncharacterized protein YjdB
MTRWFRSSALLAAAVLGACSSSDQTKPTIASVSLSPASFALAIGGTKQLSLSAVYSDHSTAVVTTAAYSSSAPSIATISDSGLVTGVAAGSATVTATAGGVSATASVTVNAAGPANVIVAFDDNYGTGITFAPFAGSSNPPVIDTAQHEQGTASLRIDLPATGYTGGAFKVSPAVDASGFNAVTFWAKSSAPLTVDKFGIGNDAADTTWQAEWLAVPLTTTWTKYTLPLPLASKLTALTGVFHYATGAGSGSFWIDQIQYETVALAAPTAAMAPSSQTLSPGDTAKVGALTVSFTVGGAAEQLTAMPRYFTFSTSNSGVATVNASGNITAVGNGTATISASLGSVAVTGSISITVGSGNTPAAAPPAPTVDPGNVISLSTKAYTNVPITSWNAFNDGAATETDVTIGADTVRKYQHLTFVGATFPDIDATQMTYVHVDVWTPDATVFKIKLVDFGANGAFGGGDDSESEITYNAPAQKTWISYDIPFSQFTGLLARAHLAQLIFTGSNSTLYVDNVYFYKAPVAPPPAVFTVFDDNYRASAAFQDFGGATNQVSIDSTVSHSGTSSLKAVIPATGYTGGAIVLGGTADLSTYNALTFWAKASAVKNLDKVGFANDNTATIPWAVEWAPVPLTTDWQQFTVPLPDPSKLTAVDGLFHFATGADAAGITIWFDDIQFETVSPGVLGTANAAIATMTVPATVGGTVNVVGQSVTWFLNGGATPTTVSLAPEYFAYASSDTNVATVDAGGVVHAIGVGATHITATFLGAAAAGDIEVDVSAATGPSAAPPAPTLASSLVISLLTSVYPNVPVDTWDATWSNPANNETDVVLGPDTVKHYAGLNYAGIEFTSHEIDASAMDHLHMDVWTNAPGLAVTLVSFGADGAFGGGDDSQGVVTTDGLAQGQWVSLDMPLSAFDGAGLASHKNLAQIVLAGDPQGGNTLYLDNVYFYATPAAHVVFDDNYEGGVNFAPFGGSANNVSVDTSTSYSGAASLKVVIPGAGQYTGGALVAPSAVDLSAYDSVTFWAKASAAKTFNAPDNTGFGNDAAGSLDYSGEVMGLALTTTWQKFTLPIPLPSANTAVTGLFHFALGGDASGITVWFDDIQYEKSGAAVLGTPAPAIATESISLGAGSTHAVDGASVNWGTLGLVEVALGPKWFTYTSTDSTVASVDASGTVTAVKAGTADITAALGAVAAAGDMTITVTGGMAPPSAPPARPTQAASQVISLFSGAYGNVPVDTWDAVWSNPANNETDLALGADTIKKYTGFNYFGIEFTGANELDATSMGYLHFDIYTDAAGVAITLVSFGADGNYGGGDDSQGVVTTDGLTAGQWISLDLPLASFDSAGLASRQHLAQIVIAGHPQSGNTLFLDNVYFHE